MKWVREFFGIRVERFQIFLQGVISKFVRNNDPEGAKQTDYKLIKILVSRAVMARSNMPNRVRIFFVVFLFQAVCSDNPFGSSKLLPEFAVGALFLQQSHPQPIIHPFHHRKTR